jgi:hypothetical protein
MNHARLIAGIGIFTIAGILAWKGQVEEALYLALPTVGFFIGEQNGKQEILRKIEERMA